MMLQNALDSAEPVFSEARSEDAILTRAVAANLLYRAAKAKHSVGF